MKMGEKKNRSEQRSEDKDKKKRKSSLFLFCGNVCVRVKCHNAAPFFLSPLTNLESFFFFVCVMFCLPDQLDQLQKKCGRVITAEEEKKDRDNGERGKHTHT